MVRNLSKLQKLQKIEITTRKLLTTMKIKTIIFMSAALFASHAGAATTLLSETFSELSSGSVPGWTETGSDLFGGVGVEVLFGVGSSHAFFQTNGSSVAGIYKSTGVTGSINETITISFDLLGRSDSAVYTGIFTASLWDGVPGVGTQLVSNVPVNPAAGITSAISFSTTLVSNTAANLHVAFNAGVSGDGDFEQAIIDNVLVTAVPEPSAALLGGLGMLALLRRRR
jgi:hypothetical protein